MDNPTSDNKTQKDADETSPGPEKKVERLDETVRGSIFDTSFGPEGSELRKAWSRVKRRRR